MSSSVPTVVVNRKGEERLRNGHPWIYKSDVVSSAAEPGDLVRVVNERKRTLGVALWSSQSQISLRFLTLGAGIDDERAFFAERLRAAIAYRGTLDIDASGFRLVSGEADRLPALVVDRYGDYLVMQTLCQGMDRRLPMLVELLVEQLSPRGVLARNDPKVRALEGLEERIDVVHGEVPEGIDVREGTTTFHVNLWHGQKTGLFLDQRENHATAARYARGKALDGFTYNGGFALQMATRAESVLALDSSAHAVATTRANVERNGVTNLDVREANVFDELRELEIAGERFDTIVLDPPAFAKNKASVPKAAAGYKEINLRAIKLLNPGGTLITCSCSYNVSEDLFLEIVEQAAADARASIALVEKRQQARDHPVLLNVPETYYLKCLVLRKLP